MKYIFWEYSDRKSRGHFEVYDKATDALKAAWEAWDTLTDKERRTCYRDCPDAFFIVYEAENYNEDDEQEVGTILWSAI